MWKFIQSIDLSAARAAGCLRDACGGVLTPFFKVVTLSGNFGLVFIVAGVIMLFFRRTRKLGVCSLLALLFGMIFTNITLKNSVARPRPFSDATSEFYSLWKAAGSLKESGYSFPSGHTTAATAFSVSLFIVLNKRYSWAFLLIPVLMGFTRIYFVVHYATDVLGGLLVGGVSSTIAYYIVKKLVKNDKIASLLP